MVGLAPVAPPRALSSFVGRQSELRELEGLIARHRLITLVGVGGCGKTRLAIEAATAAGPGFPAGVAFADLASLRAPEEVVDAVTRALGLNPGVAATIADLLGGTRLLLVIDNAEHLLDAVSVVIEDLLRRCPNLTVLVTSRELLNVDGELTWPVPLLRLPPELPPGAPPDIDEIGACDAIELFVTRATERQASFRLQPENVQLVAAICRRLDGIPLALELAAARTMSMSLGEIVTRLDDGFRLLTQGPRSSVARHQTLRATIDWSYGLLDERERRLLWRLSAFVGSFDIAAIESVCAGPDLPTADVADVLRRLVEKSLVVPQPGADGSLRYGLLEVVRQYGQERLEEAGDGDVRVRHAAYYAGVVRRLGREARSDLQGSTDRMAADYDNVRLALNWAAQRDPELEAAMVFGLRWFWMIRSLVREAREQLRRALEKERPSPEMRASLYADAAYWSQWADDLDTAKAQIAVAYATLDQIDDVRLAARIVQARATVHLGAGDLDTARADLLRTIEMVQDQPPSQSLVIARSNLAMVHVAAGRPDEALDEVERAARLQAVLPGSRSSVSLFFLLHARGAALLALGCAADAREQFLRGLDLAVALDSSGVAAGFLAYLACAAAASADPALCLELLAAAERCSRTVGSTQALAFIPIEAAERASREALGERAAARAWAAGLRLDARAALARARTRDQADPSPPLTERRLTIARLVAEGLSDKEIANRLGISKRTVETHLAHVRQKLGLSNRAQIAAWVVSTGRVSDT